jgi:phosphopantetheine adenylyltransferase
LGHHNLIERVLEK